MAISNWVRFGARQDDFFRNNRFSGAPLVTHTVSKTFSGRNRNDVISTTCLSPEECAHKHFPGNFDCDSLQSHDCDSEFSQKHLKGRLNAGFEATFGHTADVGFAKSIKDFTQTRGFFFGKFDLHDSDDDRFADGAIDGMVNVGIVRKPLKEAVESCHHVGRWYGRVHAGVKLPDNERAFLTGMLAIDVEYELTSSWLGIEFVGTLEGMLIRECKDSG